MRRCSKRASLCEIKEVCHELHEWHELKAKNNGLVFIRVIRGKKIMTQESKISVEQRGHILLIGLNRPAKRNAFDVEMPDQLAMSD